MLDEEFPYKQAMVKIPLVTARITLTSEIEHFKNQVQCHHEVSAKGDDPIMVQIISERIKGSACTLGGICLALVHIFGKELRDKVFEATNHYYVEEMDVAALDEVIAEIEKRFPLSACYKPRRDKP